LFSIITNVYIHFQIQKLENKSASVDKELQQVRKDNAALAQYINARRKEEEAQKKAEEEA
jgi:predicted CopG family antitoxin